MGPGGRWGARARRAGSALLTAHPRSWGNLDPGASWRTTAAGIDWGGATRPANEDQKKGPPRRDDLPPDPNPRTYGPTAEHDLIGLLVSTRKSSLALALGLVTQNVI